MSPAYDPICLHPENPHYFLFRGRPTVLIGSGEHYGAVLNLDFDYVRYLDAMQSAGLNVTRTFMGTYAESSESFSITGNTLAPAPGRLLAPWARSDVPGYAGGGNKFDLSRWDAAYYARLRDFVAQAGRRGIVVQLCFFSPLYNDPIIALNPMYIANNINGVGAIADRHAMFAQEDAALLAVQDAVVARAVAELSEYDNLIYETFNEPYWDPPVSERSAEATQKRLDHITAIVVQAEAELPRKHLISQNVCNGSRKVERPNPHVSLLDFHYSNPPEAVAMNYGLGLPIGDNETGFCGTANAPYRTEGWEFILAGGAHYNNLDYSFTAAHPDGTAPIPATQPGGGGVSLRRSLKVLKDLVESLGLPHVAPAPGLVRGDIPNGGAIRALAETGGGAYAVYLRGFTHWLYLDLPAGPYRTEWIDTKTGDLLSPSEFEHTGGVRCLVPPAYTEDIALRIRRSA